MGGSLTISAVEVQPSTGRIIKRVAYSSVLCNSKLRIWARNWGVDEVPVRVVERE